VWYDEYLQGPSREKTLQRILEYNEDDCRGMIAVKEYFDGDGSLAQPHRIEDLDLEIGHHSSKCLHGASAPSV
jgi:hypothetical protein